MPRDFNSKLKGKAREEFLLSMSGLERVQAAQHGKIAATFMQTLGMRFTEVAEGLVIVEMDCSEDLLNISGSMHGGAYAGLADAAGSMAALTKVPKGYAYATTKYEGTFYKGKKGNGETLTAVGQVTEIDRRVIYSHAITTDTQGEKISASSLTCKMYVPR